MRAVAALCALAAGLHTLRWAPLDYALDDAWIVARVARTWLETGAPTYDMTLPVTESVSSPLWALLAVPLVAMGLDPILPLRCLGAACWVGVVGWTSLWAAERSPRPVWGATVTGVVLAASGGLAYHAVSGLETTLWVGLVTAAAAWATGALPTWAGTLALIGVAWTRPEAPWMIIGLAAVRARSSEGPRWPLAAGACAWLALLLGRLVVYGEWLPNTAYAKAPDLWAGASYVADGLLWTGLLATVAAARWAPRLAALALWLGLGVALSGGDWMPAHRRLAEAAVLLAVGLASAPPRLAGLAALLWVTMSARAAWHETDGSAWYHAELAQVGERATAAGIHRIAAFDVGRLGWAFRGSVHDLAGLTDPHIGHAPGTHGQKPFDADWFDRRAPDWVVLTTLNDPTVEAPRFISAERAVWEHVGDTWSVVWVEPVGDPDHLLVLARPAEDATDDAQQRRR